MKLRTYILIFSVVMVGLALAIMSYNTSKILVSGFFRIQQAQTENISRVLISSIQSSEKELLSFARMLESDNDLSSTLVLARESGDSQLIKNKLRRIQEDVGYDVVDVSGPEMRPYLNSDLEFDSDSISRVLAGRGEQVLLTRFHDKPFLVVLAALKLYGKPAGVLILGRDLDLAVVTGVSHVTHSRLELTDNSGAENFEIFRDSNDHPLYAKIEVENLANTAGSLISRDLIWTGIAAILVLFVAFYVFLEFGFVRRFRALVDKLNEYTQQLRSGTPKKIIMAKDDIFEIDLLGRSFSRLSETLAEYEERIQNRSKIEAELKRQKSLASLAAQVAHDIRSPLSALNMVFGSVRGEISEQQRQMVKTAAKRINDIANDLLQKKQIGDGSDQPILVAGLIDGVLTEKRILMVGQVELVFDPKAGFGLFAKMKGADLSRVISNLINNAIESFDGVEGRVDVGLREESDRLEISILDNGRGIAPEVLAQLGQRELSAGKSGESGSGLGVFHAKTTIESAGGEFSIQSKLGRGTLVNIALPRVPTPAWFATSLRIRKGRRLICVDDDRLVLDAWAARVRSLNAGFEFLAFDSIASFSAWAVSYLQAGDFVAIDQNFENESEKGLDVIRRLRLGAGAVLVTSVYEEEDLQRAAKEQNTKILPKACLPWVLLVEESAPAIIDSHKAISNNSAHVCDP